jgi:hypothetical protein
MYRVERDVIHGVHEGLVLAVGCCVLSVAFEGEIVSETSKMRNMSGMISAAVAHTLCLCPRRICEMNLVNINFRGEGRKTY